MAKLIDFKLSSSGYLDLADKASLEGDVEKSVSYIRKALEIDDKNQEAYIALAREYAILGAQELSNAVLFKALALRPKQADKDIIFQMLAMNFLDMNQAEVAEFYLQDYADMLGIDFQELEEMETAAQNKRGGFRVVYPRGEDYYEMLIEKAYGLVRERKLDEAIALLDEVDPRSKSKDAANHVVLVCLMMKEDIDGVIDNAKKMLRENPDSLAVRCTLSTAYLMEGKEKEAYEVVDELVKKDFTKMEEILLILPILVNLNMHVEVVKYTKRVLENINSQPNTMIWLSQALYNLGAREEAKKVMRKVLTIYGEYSPAEYFLALYAKEPAQVEYSMNYPQQERLDRYKKLHDFLILQPAVAEALLDSPEDPDDALFKYKKELKSLLRWAFIDGNAQIESLIVDTLDIIGSSWGEKLLREQLVSPELSFELMADIVGTMFKRKLVHFDVVARGIFKEISFELPEVYFKASPFLTEVIEQGLFDIIYNDVEPNEYLKRYVDLVNALVYFDESGKIVYQKPKIGRLKSAKTLVGVLICKVYEDEEEDPRPETIDGYDIKEKTFDKYWKILFGDDDGRKEK
ncbi:MAG: hypothetical protein IK048_02290 [Clostridia bacterium]|nr:hypothetical protein [Clostridia bacterium]